MNVAALLNELRSRRVEVSAVDGELRYRAPKGALTDELRGAIAEHRAELLGTVERRLPTTARDLATVAEVWTMGDILGWPELVLGAYPGRLDRPYLTIMAGEANWVKALTFPPPGFLEAALLAARALVEKELPF